MSGKEIEEKIREFYVENGFYECKVSLGVVFRKNIFREIKKVILISNKPGIIIGFRGESIKKLQEKLKGIKIEIKEIYSIGCKFIDI